MKVTDISVQAKNPNRVNVSIDGKYRFSLDILQVTELGIKKGSELTEAELEAYEQESVFGKLYARTLEYTMMRPHSAKEVRDYLWRKTKETAFKSRRTGEIVRKPGVSKIITDRVYDKLVEKGYVDDEKFARYWVENRSLTKGASTRKLTAELRAKGVEQGIIDASLSFSDRDDESELQKVILKKRARYPDEQKFKIYLARQGFSFDDINRALSDLAQPDQVDERD